MARNQSIRNMMTALAMPVLCHCTPVSALGLMQAYAAAVVNDPTYLSAVYENEAGQQSRAIGRSSLLPNVSASFSTSKNNAEQTAMTVFGPKTTNPEYISRASVLSVRQPLFNLDGVARYRQGEAQSSYSEALFSGRRQELLLRVTNAYLNVLLAEDQLMLSVAQRDTLIEQKRINDLMYQKGEGTKTDVLETQAKLDLSEAQLIEAQDNLTMARNALGSIVGGEIGQLDSLPDDFQVCIPEQLGFEDWKAFAIEHNPEISAQSYAVESALQDVRKSRAGHAPRLDLVANYSKSDAESINTFNQSANVRSVGIQLNIPIYAGGYVNAMSVQALANHNRAKSDLAATTAKVLVELRKQYDLTRSSLKRIDALVKAVDSARQLIRATEQSVKGGLRVNLDVLNAQQQLFAARRDLAQARYGYLLAYLRLRAAAGILAHEDLLQVAAYFTARS